MLSSHTTKGQIFSIVQGQRSKTPVRDVQSIAPILNTKHIVYTSNHILFHVSQTTKLIMNAPTNLTLYTYSYVYILRNTLDDGDSHPHTF